MYQRRAILQRWLEQNANNNGLGSISTNDTCADIPPEVLDFILKNQSHSPAAGYHVVDGNLYLKLDIPSSAAATLVLLSNLTSCGGALGAFGAANAQAMTENERRQVLAALKVAQRGANNNGRAQEYYAVDLGGQYAIIAVTRGDPNDTASKQQEPTPDPVGEASKQRVWHPREPPVPPDWSKLRWPKADQSDSPESFADDEEKTPEELLGNIVEKVMNRMRDAISMLRVHEWKIMAGNAPMWEETTLRALQSIIDQAKGKGRRRMEPLDMRDFDDFATYLSEFDPGTVVHGERMVRWNLWCYGLMCEAADMDIDEEMIDYVKTIIESANGHDERTEGCGEVGADDGDQDNAEKDGEVVEAGGAAKQEPVKQD